MGKKEKENNAKHQQMKELVLWEDEQGIVSVTETMRGPKLPQSDRNRKTFQQKPKTCKTSQEDIL